MEKETATHTSILAWKISWTEEPGRLQSVGLQRLQCGRPRLDPWAGKIPWRSGWLPVPVISGRSKGASEKSGILCSWEGSLGTPLGLAQRGGGAAPGLGSVGVRAASAPASEPGVGGGAGL